MIVDSARTGKFLHCDENITTDHHPYHTTTCKGPNYRRRPKVLEDHHSIAFPSVNGTKMFLPGRVRKNRTEMSGREQSGTVLRRLLHRPNWLSSERGRANAMKPSDRSWFERKTSLTILVLFNIVLSVKESMTLSMNLSPCSQSSEYEQGGVRGCHTLTPLMRGPGKVPPARTALTRKNKCMLLQKEVDNARPRETIWSNFIVGDNEVSNRTDRRMSGG